MTSNESFAAVPPQAYLFLLRFSLIVKKKKTIFPNNRFFRQRINDGWARFLIIATFLFFFSTAASCDSIIISTFAALITICSRLVLKRSYNI